MRGVLRLLAGQPGANGPARFVGKQESAAADRDLGPHGPGKDVLKEIFSGLGPYFIDVGKIKRTTHDASPWENQPISAQSSHLEHSLPALHPEWAVAQPP